MPINFNDHTTVYPARAGGFPPASFGTFADSLGYVQEVSNARPPCGICTCPAGSYHIHYPETVRNLNLNCRNGVHHENQVPSV